MWDDGKWYEWANVRFCRGRCVNPNRNPQFCNLNQNELKTETFWKNVKWFELPNIEPREYSKRQPRPQFDGKVMKNQIVCEKRFVLPHVD